MSEVFMDKRIEEAGFPEFFEVYRFEPVRRVNMSDIETKIEEWERLEKEATEGPWKACGHARGGCNCGQVWSEPMDGVVAVAGKPWQDGEEEYCVLRPEPDAAFIAASREAVPRLIAEVRRLERENSILAAGACPEGNHDLIGDDGGNFYCDMKTKSKQLKAELDKLITELGRTRKREIFARHVAEVRLKSHWKQHYEAQIEKLEAVLDETRRMVCEKEALDFRLPINNHYQEGRTERDCLLMAARIHGWEYLYENDDQGESTDEDDKDE